MQNVIIDKPYEFVPPHDGRLWFRLLRPFLPGFSRRRFGIARVEFRDLDLLRESLAKGRGILLAPNHPRPADPAVMSLLAAELRQPFFTMAAWFLFMQGRLQRWVLRRMGAFSIYREGLDRSAVSHAIEILASARRPLVMFPEGVITRTNDVLFDLLDGVTFIARSAARRRAKAGSGEVVIHPVALKYFFEGSIEPTLEPVLADIEQRLTWRVKHVGELVPRITKIGGALLSLKETEFLGEPQSGSLSERLDRLIHSLLHPLEEEWVQGQSEGNVVVRVKRLRTAIVPDLLERELAEAERERRWRQLADLYLAQQLSCYPPDYVRSGPTPERMLETVERFEEDLTDGVRVHRPIRAVVQIGEALEVGAEKVRGRQPDPLLEQLRDSLQTMLAGLAEERPT